MAETVLGVRAAEMTVACPATGLKVRPESSEATVFPFGSLMYTCIESVSLVLAG